MRFGDLIDFSRWAVVSYNDDTGLGRQACDLKKVLGLGHHFVLPSVRLQTKPIDGKESRMLPLDASEGDLSALLDDIQGIFLLERLTHHLPLVLEAKKRGVVVACVPNWEHFAGWLSLYRLADLFLCPTAMTHRVLRFFGFSNSIQVPCPLDLGLLPERRVTGQARLFIHNGGVANKDDRKGTREVIEAFKQVPRPDIRLLVRLQKKIDLPALDPRIEVSFGNLESPMALYAKGDVAIQPSKLEGIGLSVLEAAVSGLPVITSDYPPMNEFVRDSHLLCRVGWKFHRVKTTRGIYHSHLKKPSVRDLAKKIEWCAGHDMEPFSLQGRALRESVYSPEKVREVWRQTLQAHADNRLSILHPPSRSFWGPAFLLPSLFFRAARTFFEWRKRGVVARPAPADAPGSKTSTEVEQPATVS